MITISLSLRLQSADFDYEYAWRTAEDSFLQISTDSVCLFGYDLGLFPTMCSFWVFVVYRPRGASRTSRVALLGAGAHVLDAAAAVRGGPGPTSRGAAMTSAP